MIIKLQLCPVQICVLACFSLCLGAGLSRAQQDNEPSPEATAQPVAESTATTAAEGQEENKSTGENGGDAVATNEDEDAPDHAVETAKGEQADGEEESAVKEEAPDQQTGVPEVPADEEAGADSETTPAGEPAEAATTTKAEEEEAAASTAEMPDENADRPTGEKEQKPAAADAMEKDEEKETVPREPTQSEAHAESSKTPDNGSAATTEEVSEERKPEDIAEDDAGEEDAPGKGTKTETEGEEGSEVPVSAPETDTEAEQQEENANTAESAPPNPGDGEAEETEAEGAVQGGQTAPVEDGEAQLSPRETTDEDELKDMDDSSSGEQAAPPVKPQDDEAKAEQAAGRLESAEDREAEPAEDAKEQSPEAAQPTAAPDEVPPPKREKRGTPKDEVSEKKPFALPPALSIGLAAIGLVSLAGAAALVTKRGASGEKDVFAFPPVFTNKAKRIAILGDIHGNVPALDAVLADIRDQRISQIVSTGDLVGYGAEPEACVRRIAEAKVPVVKGNHDQYAASTDEMPKFKPEASNTIFWTRGRVSDACKRYLDGLPYTLEYGDFQVVHGNLFDPAQFKYVLKKEDAEVAFEDQTRPLCFVGHSHVPAAFCHDGTVVKAVAPESVMIEPGKRYIVNLGSVGQSRDGNAQASYAVYDRTAKRVEIRRVTYSVSAAQDRIRHEGLPEKNAARLSEAR